MSYVTVFPAGLRSRLLQEPWGSRTTTTEGQASEVLRGYFEKCRSQDGLNRIMYADIKTSLTDDLLALTDKMSMAASIECRAPFVDQELIERQQKGGMAEPVNQPSLRHDLHPGSNARRARSHPHQAEIARLKRLEDSAQS